MVFSRTFEQTGVMSPHTVWHHPILQNPYLEAHAVPVRLKMKADHRGGRLSLLLRTRAQGCSIFEVGKEVREDHASQ